QDALRRITGQPITVKVDLTGGPAPAGQKPRPDSPPGGQAAERRKQLMQLPLFKRAAEALGARLWHADEAFNPAAARPAAAAPPPAAVADEDPPAPESDPDEG